MTKSTAVIVDIDGTLADMRPVRHLVRTKPKDYDGFHSYGVTDAQPIRETVDRVRGHAAAGHSILYVSGRKQKWTAWTQEWMTRHDIPIGLLFLRADGDNRPDHLVKREIWERSIEPVYAVIEAIDDRPSIIELWTSLGIPVHRVPGWED